MSYSKNCLIGLFFLLFFLVFIACSLAFADQNLHPEVNDFPKIHPVLGSSAQVQNYGKDQVEQLMERRQLKAKLGDSTFKKMIDLSIPDEWTRKWATAYGQAEMEAAYQLAIRLKGCTKAQVQRLLGKPVARGDSPLCDSRAGLESYHAYYSSMFGVLDDTHKVCKDKAKQGGKRDSKHTGLSQAMSRAKMPTARDSENWLYFFGGRRLTIRPLFVGDVCTAVTVCAYEDDQPYLKWRMVRLEKSAVGKTRAQILAQEGPGMAGQYLKPWDKTKPINLEERQRQSFRESSHATDFLQYQLGSGGKLLLGFKNGICIGICKSGMIWHTFGMGGRSWDHNDYDPVFRMP